MDDVARGLSPAAVRGTRGYLSEYSALSVINTINLFIPRDISIHLLS